MREKILFIYNPNAGKKKIVNKLNDVVNQLIDDQYDLVISPTRKANDAKEAVIAYMNEGNCTKIVCSGGDGTLHEVVDGLMQVEKKAPIVYLPAGSTNDFGYSLDIPMDIVDAAALAKEGEPFNCDIACINGTNVVYTAAFGLFTDVSYATKQSMKNALGHAAYILNGAGALTRIKNFKTVVTIDDNEVIEDTFIIGMVVSAASIGGFRGITGPDVNMNDGKYELFLIKNPGVLHVAGLVMDMKKHNFENPNIIYRHINKVKFEFEEEVPWTVDGEYGGSFQEADIVVNKSAVTFMIPKTEVLENAE